AVVAGQLFALQGRKCCFCERPLVEPDYHDVEHYRPKARARRDPGSVQTHGYWWLAWAWDNLLLACNPCNRSHKRDRFPLAPGSVALQQEEQPPGAERPFLIDPSQDDPINEIEFFEEVIGTRRRWVPRGRAGSLLGDWTIRVLGLDRPHLIDAY